jgi:streptogramin lyase
VALAAAVAVIAFVASSGEDPALEGISAGSVGRIDPGGNAFVEEVDVGGLPAGVAAGFGATWSANEADGTVSRVDAGTKRVRTLATGFHPQSVAVGARAVWIGSPVDGTVLRIDPVLRKVTRRIAAGGGGVAVSGSSVWTTEDRTTAVRIGAVRGVVRSRIQPDLGARGVAAGGAGVWLLGGLHLLRVNEQLNDVDLTVRLSGNPVAVAVSADAVWATFVDLESGSGMLVRVGETGTVEASAEIGADVGAVALGSGSVWVASLSDRSVVRVDAETMEIVARIRVGALPTGIVAGNDAVWVGAA